MKETAQGVRSRGGPAAPLLATLTAVLLAVPTGCVSTAGTDTSAMSFSHEPLVGKVVWNDLITQDLDVARRFYGEMFGWTAVDMPMPEGVYTLFQAGGDDAAAVYSAPPGVPVHWGVYFSVTSADDSAAQAWLRSRNTALGGVPLDLIRDPAGLVRTVDYLDAARARI